MLVVVEDFRFPSAAADSNGGIEFFADALRGQAIAESPEAAATVGFQGREPVTVRFIDEDREVVGPCRVGDHAASAKERACP